RSSPASGPAPSPRTLPSSPPSRHCYRADAPAGRAAAVRPGSTCSHQGPSPASVDRLSLIGMDDTVGRTAAAPGGRGGRREQIKQEKLGRIVRAAATLFSERGFAATTTQAIAEEAGIGAGTLFLYVRSKHDLLVRVVVE